MNLRAHLEQTTRNHAQLRRDVTAARDSQLALCGDGRVRRAVPCLHNLRVDSQRAYFQRFDSFPVFVHPCLGPSIKANQPFLLAGCPEVAPRAEDVNCGGRFKAAFCFRVLGLH